MATTQKPPEQPSENPAAQPPEEGRVQRTAVATLERPPQPIDESKIFLQVVYNPSLRTDFKSGSMQSGPHAGIMRFPRLGDKPENAHPLSTMQLYSVPLVPEVAVPLSLAEHNKMLRDNPNYEEMIRKGVIEVVYPKPNLEKPTNSTLDYDDADAIKVVAQCADLQWLRLSLSDPRPSVRIAIDEREQFLKDVENGIRAAENN